MIIISQDQELFEITQVFYKDHYVKQFSKGFIGSLMAKKILAGVNVYGYDKKGVKRLLDSYNDELEAKHELFNLNSSKDYVKFMTIY